VVVLTADSLVVVSGCYVCRYAFVALLMKLQAAAASAVAKAYLVAVQHRNHSPTSRA